MMRKDTIMLLNPDQRGIFSWASIGAGEADSAVITDTMIISAADVQVGDTVAVSVDYGEQPGSGLPDWMYRDALTTRREALLAEDVGVVQAPLPEYRAVPEMGDRKMWVGGLIVQREVTICGQGSTMVDMHYPPEETVRNIGTAPGGTHGEPAAGKLIIRLLQRPEPSLRALQPPQEYEREQIAA